MDEQIWTLLEDDRLIRWAQEPDEETERYWQDWLQEHPDQARALFRAKALARDIGRTQRPHQPEEISVAAWQGIEAGIRHARTVTMKQRRRKTFRFLAAASLTGIIILGVSLLYYRQSAIKPADGLAPRIANILLKDDIERVNRTLATQVVYLVDGSRVVLAPGARIRHALFLRKDRREVFLEGKAFFDVAPDPARPFYVNTKFLDVRVLGTSFTLDADQHGGDASVTVHSGKIAVSAPTASTDQLILIRNQKALFRAQTHRLLSVYPAPAETDGPKIPALSFQFDDAPVSRVFHALEDAYGIPLHYDEKLFSTCTITTSLSEESFDEKLMIICEALGAEYRIDHDGVYIKSKGDKPCR